jgi:hypothetical protein
MKTRLTLKPGQRGTRKLVEEYGEKLLYVRYRYDAERKRRVKTVEVIVDEAPWLPGMGRISRTTCVGVEIAVEEMPLRKQVKEAGGIWNPQKRVWELAYGQVVRLGLEDRIKTELL